MKQNINLAVLIDGDNIPSANVKEMMEEIAKYGNWYGSTKNFLFCKEQINY